MSFPEVLQTRGEYQVKPPLPFVPGSEVGGIVRSAPDGSTSAVAVNFARSTMSAARSLVGEMKTATMFASSAAAAGIALINSLGGLGGFFAPMARTAAEAAFHSTSAGLTVLGGASVLAAIVIGALVRTRESSTIPDTRGKPAKAS